MQLNKKNPRDPQFADQRDQFEEDYDMDGAETNDARGESTTRTRVRPDGEGEQVSRAARNESVVDANSAFDGKYETSQDLRIQGTISGEIVCRGLLTIEQEATAKASIQARDAHVRGRLEGDITCSGRLLLASTAVVTGTLKAGSLVIEEGASLSGNVETAGAPIASQPAAPAAQTAARATTAEPAAPAAPERASSVSSSRGPSWSGERRANGGSTTETTPARNGRQAPSFAFVPTSEERAAAADRS